MRRFAQVLCVSLLFFGQATVAQSHRESSQNDPKLTVELRTVSVRIYADPDFQKRPNWKGIVRARLKRVSVMYREDFNIEFKAVDFKTWTPRNVVDLCELTSQLQSFMGPNDPELAIGFTTHTDPKTLACSQDFTRAALIPDNGSAAETDVDLHIAHELGHLFGGWHLPDRASIMYGFRDGLANPRFDKYNEQAIMLMRTFDFYKGVQSIDESTVEAFTKLYNASPHFPESVNPISEAYDGLGIRLTNEGKNEDAIADYKKAANIDTRNAEAHFNYGLTAMHNDQTTGLAELCAAATQFLQRADRYLQEENDRENAWTNLCRSAQSIAQVQSMDPSSISAASILQALNERRAAICPQCVCSH